MIIALGLLGVARVVTSSISVDLPAEAHNDLSDTGASVTFPPPRQTQQRTHDPSIILVGNTFYLYNVGEHIIIHTASKLNGPWKRVGSVLDENSVIPKGDRAAPWAPTVVAFQETFYCYYSVSKAGCRDSAVGVATSDSPGPGSWLDHGIVVQTGTGKYSDRAPYNVSNAIDPATLILTDGSAYLTYGSYWTGIYQVPLTKDLLSPVSTTQPDTRHLAYEPQALGPPNPNADSICGDPTGPHAIEGAFTSYHSPYYYLWLSHGRCCDLDRGTLPTEGAEYSIRVGRSQSPRGPYFDRNGTDLVNGGGTVIYGSNGDTYAPGGQGVIQVNGTDFLYYHYRESQPD
ncbi:putative arabinan endo-1,5-alpha-L-arabinosidase B [Penicillium oxalicum]|uniref:putative arabinan endo-1,5-alpha-L-arabinosidase B n=1 Tax=Penicillium oxalicum TaxID=69781 RepID=UPI0020B89897|nr:putative arabinan endo-1,5-alpha-L-arabinosidase B [Penicillium oxalicum]KAI2790578.1 putative arabinan endo-1,5-alpha-L-arabinosidase B [Penicillium oxalicum]